MQYEQTKKARRDLELFQQQEQKAQDFMMSCGVLTDIFLRKEEIHNSIKKNAMYGLSSTYIELFGETEPTLEEFITFKKELLIRLSEVEKSIKEKK